MDVPNGALIVVADGRRMLWLRNEGDAEFPNLQLETKREHDNPADRDQGTDRPGRAFSAGGNPRGGQGQQTGSANRSGYEETDFHQLEEDRFAGEVADMLKKRALAHDISALVVIAPPRTLGELRKHYHKEVQKALIGEIHKDLTGHPVVEIERLLKAA